MSWLEGQCDQMVSFVDLPCPVGAHMSLIRKSGPTNGSMTGSMGIGSAVFPPHQRLSLPWGHSLASPVPPLTPGFLLRPPLSPLPEGSPPRQGFLKPWEQEGGRESAQEETPHSRSCQGGRLPFCSTTDNSHQTESLLRVGERDLSVAWDDWT